jgi:hypothetical protein
VKDLDLDLALTDICQPFSDLTSLRSTVRQYQVEHGRTYHGLSAGSTSKKVQQSVI